MFAALSRLRDRRAEGFSLIELLVVVLIIGVLIGIAVPAFLNQRRTAQDQAVKAELTTVLKDAKSYYLDVSGDSYEGYTLSPDMMSTGVAVGAAGEHTICLEAKTSYGQTWLLIDVANDFDGAPEVGTYVGSVDSAGNWTEERPEPFNEETGCADFLGVIVGTTPADEIDDAVASKLVS